MYTILLNADKQLITSVRRPIYQGENRSDEIQFLIDQNFYSNITTSKILLQVVFPALNKETNEPISKLRYMELDQVLYKNRYRMVLPISSVMTKDAGTLVMWFMFLGENDGVTTVIKTGTVCLEILPVIKSSDVPLEDDESFDILVQMNEKIDRINQSKIDNFKYDNGAIQFFANEIPVGEPVQVEDKIPWINWD